MSRLLICSADKQSAKIVIMDSAGITEAEFEILKAGWVGDIQRGLPMVCLFTLIVPGLTKAPPGGSAILQLGVEEVMWLTTGREGSMSCSRSALA